MRISDWSSDVCSSDLAAGANSDSENKFATGLNLGSGVALQGTSKINAQGTLNQTGNTLDMAIEGSGYFRVQQPDGSIAYRSEERRVGKECVSTCRSRW